MNKAIIILIIKKIKKNIMDFFQTLILSKVKFNELEAISG